MSEKKTIKLWKLLLIIFAVSFLLGWFIIPWISQRH